MGPNFGALVASREHSARLPTESPRTGPRGDSVGVSQGDVAWPILNASELLPFVVHLHLLAHLIRRSYFHLLEISYQNRFLVTVAMFVHHSHTSTNPLGKDILVVRKNVVYLFLDPG